MRDALDDPEIATKADNELGGSNTPLPLEYQIASGDSGGGSFLQENGNWYLAGVHSGTNDFFTWPGTNDSHTYGDVSLVTRVSAYQHFITSNIPDTQSITVLVDRNPAPFIGSFDVSQGALPYIHLRIKMSESSNIRVIVTAGGRHYQAIRNVGVTISGCGV